MFKMTDITKKLDFIINSLNSVEQKLEKLENRFTSFEKRLTAHETRIEKLEKDQIEYQKTNSELQNQINEIKMESDQVKRRAKHQELLSELYSKRFNYLIYGIDEIAWEKREQTEKLFRNFLKEGLKIEDPNAIPLADIHRLPQHPIFNKEHKKITRPIIIKFINIFDKHQFTQNLRNLKECNAKGKAKHATASYVYATEHLPKELQKQKKALMPLFLEAKKNKQKTAWKLQDCEYRLFVDNELVDQPIKNQSLKEGEHSGSGQYSSDSSDEN